jgi:hypothetical protein
MFNQLRAAGFDIEVRNHAGAIMAIDFAVQEAEITASLINFRIPSEDIIASGGGEAESTQRLRRTFYDADWPKHNFQFQLIVDGVETVGTSHEIDHVRAVPGVGRIALEIEWNNKDPFFDRDLENFQRLHAQSAISLGIIITRGSTMQPALRSIVENCIRKYGILDEAGMIAQFDMKDRTKRQREAVDKLLKKQIPFAEAFSRQFCNDKFGQATTHWAKLKERIDRGVGNPCPMVLIGLPASIIRP